MTIWRHKLTWFCADILNIASSVFVVLQVNVNLRRSFHRNWQRSSPGFVRVYREVIYHHHTLNNKHSCLQMARLKVRKHTTAFDTRSWLMKKHTYGSFIVCQLYEHCYWHFYVLVLCSASRHQLIVPRQRRIKFDCPALSVAGSTAWNSLQDYLRDPSLSEDTCRRSLKTYLFALY